VVLEWRGGNTSLGGLEQYTQAFLRRRSSKGKYSWKAPSWVTLL